MNVTDTPENKQQAAHLDELKRMYRMGHSADAIRDYIENVKRTEGRFRGVALRDVFGNWWKEQQRGKQ